VITDALAKYKLTNTPTFTSVKPQFDYHFISLWLPLYRLFHQSS